MAADHGIPASMLSTIFTGKEAIIHVISSGIALKKKNFKTTLHKKLEQALALFTWFKDIRATNIPLSRKVVQQNCCFACLLGRYALGQAPLVLLISPRTFNAMLNHRQAGDVKVAAGMRLPLDIKFME